MGIRFECPNGHKLHVKAFLAGKRGICPECDARFIVPAASGVRAEATSPTDAKPQEEAPQEEAVIQPPVTEQTGESPQLQFNLAGSATETPVLRHQRSRRSRRERTRRISIALGGLVLILAVALVLVLWQQP